MLSFGIELERAFSIAFWSARLAAGSARPSFAATMIARVSFEKSLPRLASAAAFLCLIDDHLLCPDIGLLPHDLEEPLVNARVVGQLRMERCHEEATLARQDRMAVELREHLDLRRRLFEPGRADEDSAERLLALSDVDVSLEAVHLPAEGVAPRAPVAETEMVAIEHDHPGARPEDRPAELPYRLVEAVQPHQPADRRRLAAGDDQPVEPVELLRQSDLDRLRAQQAQHRRVLAEVSLHGEDADRERRIHSLDGNEGYSAAGTTGAPLRRPRRPSRTSQKPSSPNARAGAHGLTCAGVAPEATSLMMLAGWPTR